MTVKSVSLLREESFGCNRLSQSAVTDMQLHEITDAFIPDGLLRAAVLSELTAFCTDSASVSRRQAFLSDIMSLPEVENAAVTLLSRLETAGHINELTFFDALPQTSALKSFMFTESLALFVREASALSDGWRERLPLSPQLSELVGKIHEKTLTDDVAKLLSDAAPLREGIDRIRSLRVNRFYSRGQNIENSILTGSGGTDLTALFTSLAASLGMGDLTPAGERRDDKPSLRLCEAICAASPELFRDIKTFNTAYKDFFDDRLLGLMYDLRVLLGLKELLSSLRAQGFPLARVKITGGTTAITHMYSPLLASRGVLPGGQVANDLAFDAGNSLFTVTGPNGGGKTVFISAVGVNLLLFAAGGYMLAEHAECEVLKGFYTHFPASELTDSGRLFREKEETASICAKAPLRSLVLLNETYSGTKTETAVAMGGELIEALKSKNAVMLYVTHFHELKTADGVIPLTALADEEENGRRLYRIVPESSQKGSFAKSILLKHRLTEDALFRRLENGEGSVRG